MFVMLDMLFVFGMFFLLFLSYCTSSQCLIPFFFSMCLSKLRLKNTHFFVGENKAVTQV